MDWPWLCAEARDHLARDPDRTLSDLDAVRAWIVDRGRARLWAAGGSALDAIDLQGLVAAIPDRPRTEPHPRITGQIRGRLAQRGQPADVVHAGLLDPNRQSGIAMLSVPLAGLDDADHPEVLMDLLAALTMAGGGAHGVFMQTWGAGLAYSNGIGAGPGAGLLSYYAERCPLLPRTVQFVIDLLAAPPQPDLVDYALASVFTSRGAAGYGERVSGLALDRISGRGPEKIRRFREALLALKQRPDLATQLAQRRDGVFQRLFPGSDRRRVEGYRSLVIGDRDQLDAWSDWLEAAGEPALVVLSPRDFWLPGDRSADDGG